MSIDVVYTLAKLHPHAMKPYKHNLIEILSELRFDKMKPVRDTCVEALTIVKEVPDIDISL